VTLNWIGLIAAAATFSGVWIGHVAVRKIEYHSPTIWLPSSVALVLGLLLELGSLMSDNAYLSAALGIFGITVLWDAPEFWRQHRRVWKGHAPANPNNPRHARLLQSSSTATVINLLERNPLGRPLSPDDLRKT
jgi:hypothetical protein